MHFEVERFSSFKRLGMVPHVFVTHRLHAFFQSPSGQVLASIVQQGGRSLSQHKVPQPFSIEGSPGSWRGSSVAQPLHGQLQLLLSAVVCHTLF